MIVKIEDGTIPNHKYHDHKRARNWVAVVQRDMSKPGGLDRQFLQRAPGHRVFVEGVEVGEVLEFAGDYYSAKGSQKPDREYFLVRELTPEGMSLQPCDKDDIGKEDNPVCVPKLVVYFDATRHEQDGQGFCVDEEPDGPGNRFMTPEQAAKVIVHYLNEWASNETRDEK
jgi:hypothetical protein